MQNLGISRAYIFELAEQLKLDYEEKNIEPYDVYTADEAFMTGTPFCLLPVTSLNSVPIGNKEMGKITKMLLEKWGENVGVDIVSQIKAFNSEIENLKGVAGPTPYQFR